MKTKIFGLFNRLTGARGKGSKSIIRTGFLEGGIYRKGTLVSRRIESQHVWSGLGNDNNVFTAFSLTLFVNHIQVLR